MWFWTVLFIVWWGVFFLMPIYGISYAFFDYKPGRVLTMNDFVGLKHFVSFFQSRDAMKIIRNTLVLSGKDAAETREIYETLLQKTK